MIEDGNASHLEVLEEIWKIQAYETVLEYGCGMYSTPFFLKHTHGTVSIDLSQEWLVKAGKFLIEEEHKRWRPVYLDSELGEESLKYLHQKYSLLFVDGAVAIDRHVIVQAGMLLGTAPVIVAHDTERQGFLHSTISLPPRWLCLRVEKDMPWTSVYSTSLDVIGQLGNRFLGKVSLYRTTDELAKATYPYIPSYKDQQAEKLKNLGYSV